MKRLLITVGVAAVAAAAAAVATKILESHRQIPDDELPPVPPEEAPAAPSDPLTPAQHLKAAAAGAAAKILDNHRQIPDDEEPPIPMTSSFQEEPAAAQGKPLPDGDSPSSPPAPEKPLA